MNNLANIAAVFFVVTFLLPVSACAATSHNSRELSGRWLITAKIKEAKFIRQEESADRVFPPVYLATLVGVKTIQGNTESFPKTIKVEIKANHIEEAAKYDRIYAVIEINGEDFKVLYWDQLLPIACVPKKLIETRYEDHFLLRSLDEPNHACMYVKGYQSHSDEITTDTEEPKADE